MSRSCRAFGLGVFFSLMAVGCGGDSQTSDAAIDGGVDVDLIDSTVDSQDTGTGDTSAFDSEVARRDGQAPDAPVVPDATDDATPDATLTATTILSGLGVKEIASPPPATVIPSSGKEVTVDPSTWHPLKKINSVFLPRAELLLIGAGNDANNLSAYYKDGVGSDPYALVSNPGAGADPAWLQSSRKTAVTADLDGDGLAEGLVFYALPSDQKLYFRVFKNRVLGPQGIVDGVALSAHTFENYGAKRVGIGSIWFPYLNSARGDVNGDGRDEALVVDYNTVHVVNLKGSGTSYSASAVTAKQFRNPVSSVVAGDINGDHVDDIVVGEQGGLYAIYGAGFKIPFTSPEETGLNGINVVEAALGDFKGNGAMQLALVGDLNGVTQISMLDFDPANFKLSAPVNTFTYAYNPCEDNDGTTDYYRLLPRAADLSGSGKAQLAVLGSVFTDPMNSATRYDLPPDSILHTEATVVDTVVGDADNDGRDDLVIQTIGLKTGPRYVITGMNSANQVVAKKTIVGNGSLDAIREPMLFGNFEDNSPRVHYAGHTLTFTDPIVIAALASAPYYKDVAQADANYASSYASWITSFGTTSSNSESTSHSVGFSVGASFEFEHKVDVPIFGITIAKVKATASINNTFKWEWASGNTVNKSITYTCGGGENRVIFTSVPMDQYEYVIDYSNDTVNNPVGKSLFITIPRHFSTYSVTQEFFNAHIDPRITRPIDGTVFAHTLGAPQTYPTVARKNALLTAAFPGDPKAQANYQYGPQSVAMGSIASAGTANLQISVSKENSDSFSYDFSLDTSVGVGVGDWTAAITAGFQTGYSTTSSSAEGTVFGGTVGFLPDAYYMNPNYAYQSGVFVYPHSTPAKKTFWVVNYWVE